LIVEMVHMAVSLIILFDGQSLLSLTSNGVTDGLEGFTVYGLRDMV